MDATIVKTPIGFFHGNKREKCLEFLSIPYAHAGRFEYATPQTEYGDFDATKHGPSCMQKRAYPEFEHLEVPERAFYHREFRENNTFTYEEDALHLNIYRPLEEGKYPVIVYFHGGGFDSGSIHESPFDGQELASRGNIVVFAAYRVAIFGYFTHEDIQKEEGRDGNFGLDDMLVVLGWVKQNIGHFGGDAHNITLMGQSAGAMSIQYLLCSDKAKGLFDKAIMMSGAGLFPKFSLPRPCEQTREYWQEVMAIAGAKTLAEFKALPAKELLAAVEVQKGKRKDNAYNTMPVIDHYILEKPIDIAIKTPMELPLMIGFTNNDMFTFLLAHIASKYAKKHSAYLYYFDIDAKGDDNQAFHSCDLRYMFGTLRSSWRPYGESDFKASRMMMDYVSAFAKTGDPNHDGAPRWERYHGKPLRFGDDGVSMRKPKTMKLLRNTLKGDPK
ncbi:MAG: carboxylesterase family protein [Bacilli bacterium]|nr:carboxylesterase family protein [Bacilli bacterium]